MPSALLDMDAIKTANHMRGHHYFEPATMRFFASRVSQQVFPCFDARTTYFVTSEQNRGHGERRWSVRKAAWDTGECDTVGQFQAYGTLKQALGAARRMVRRETE